MYRALEVESLVRVARSDWDAETSGPTRRRGVRRTGRLSRLGGAELSGHGGSTDLSLHEPLTNYASLSHGSLSLAPAGARSH